LTAHIHFVITLINRSDQRDGGVVSVLGIDVGTTGCKGLLLARDDEIFLTARHSYPLEFPRPGWVELDGQLVLEAVRQVVSAATTEADAMGDPLLAIAVSASGDEAVPVDSAGVGLYPAIMSMDVRSLEEGRLYAETVGAERLYRLTGLPVAANWPLVRLIWLRQHEPEVFKQTAHYLSWEDLVLTWLGAEPVTDDSLAARTMAFDISRRRWSAELLGAADLDPDLFPRSEPSGRVVGKVSPARCKELGLRAPVSLVTGGFDQAMAVLGAGLHRPGEAVVGTGTWEALTVIVEQPRAEAELLAAGFTFGCHVDEGLFYAMATNPGGGSVASWALDALRVAPAEANTTSPSVDDVLQALPDGPTRLVALAHFEGSYNPWMDPGSTGVIQGLRLGTTPEQIFKALLEAITFELRESISRLRASGVAIDALRATGGGARSAAWLQLKADILGVPVSTINVRETGCLAAACLAATAIGHYGSAHEAIDTLVREAQRFECRQDVHDCYADPFSQYLRLYHALRPGGPLGPDGGGSNSASAGDQSR
jgi:xylulokinase